MVLGEQEIRRWVSLAVLPSLATDKPAELVRLSIVRARFCEQLAQLTGFQPLDKAFLMGMFSVLDALVDRPLQEALQEVNLDADITRALLGTAPEKDPLACIYLLTRCNEFGDWDQVESLSQYCGVSTRAISNAYLDATGWAERAMLASN
jgi:c-di-GMP-related signal transduction protein